MDRSAQVFFRKAVVTDIDPVWRIILQAKEQMRLLGSRQWRTGIPLWTISGGILRTVAGMYWLRETFRRLWRRAVRRRTGLRLD